MSIEPAGFGERSEALGEGGREPFRYPSVQLCRVCGLAAQSDSKLKARVMRWTLMARTLNLICLCRLIV